MKIKNHQLVGDNIEYLDCPKNSEKFALSALDTIIIHYTAGSSAESSAKYLCKNNVKASAHIVIGKKGEVYQLVSFDTKTWHAGRSEYAGRKWFNNFSIGIEIDNAGVLTKTENAFRSWFGSSIPSENVLKAKHRNELSEKYWELYTKEQLMVCNEICTLLIEQYNIKNILGHEEICPGRKHDPGPAFPLDKFRNQLLYSDRQTEDDKFKRFTASVQPNLLNIRSGPGVSFDKITNPLERGTELTVIDEQDGWYHVETKLKGWVAKRHVI